MINYESKNIPPPKKKKKCKKNKPKQKLKQFFTITI